MMNVYAFLNRLFLMRTPPPSDSIRRIVLVLPCCIGDVVLATAALMALRRLYPSAHIAWAVGRWSRAAIEDHVLLNEIVDTGAAANPARGPVGVLRMAKMLRAGKYDLMVSLTRSPWMSAAALLSGIPWRAGIDSAGRGFGYNLRVPVEPEEARHEASIYLSVVRFLGGKSTGCVANVPVSDDALQRIRARMSENGAGGAYVVINPAGGDNPGMKLHSKRWPPGHFAALADRLAAELGVRLVLVAGPDDAPIVDAVQANLKTDALRLDGALTFPEIAALAHDARGYIGNDTGLTHLAAAAGARTVMILGPSDPARYAPFTPDSLALWRPVTLNPGGVAAASDQWDWARDGISVDEAADKTLAFLRES